MMNNAAIFWAIIGVGVAVVAIVITYFQWAIGRAEKKGMFNQRINDAHERMKAYDSHSLECEKRFMQLEERKTDNSAFEEIRLDLAIIKRSVGPKMQLFQSQSPMMLTELGRKVAAESGANKGVDANWPYILSQLEKYVTSQNPYDIQQVCFTLAIADLETILLPEDLDSLKVHAFKEGDPLAYYGQVVGIIIRDKYFESKGIDIADIDKHDPAKHQ